jgi:putative SOS response-associated peptidase YedK
MRRRIGLEHEFVREIHTRMPVILPEEHHDVWLSGEAGKEVLVPFPADRMRAWPVSPRVNSPKNNDAEIMASIELNTGRDSVSDPRVGTLL